MRGPLVATAPVTLEAMQCIAMNSPTRPGG